MSLSRPASSITCTPNFFAEILRNTKGDAEELRAYPEYVNATAYQTLRQARFPFARLVSHVYPLEKISDAFQHAQDHVAACGLRPAVDRPKPMQWYTTFQHFRPWAAVMSGIYVVGHLRPAKTQKRPSLHPGIAK